MRKSITKEKRKSINFFIDESDWKKLKKLAKVHDTNMSVWIRHSIVKGWSEYQKALRESA